ncbi:hypothetical protein [Sphaerotilus sp.]|uniref:hypothetical protein n=1 Tax=Sphaerotilus sp. TaxID=2093942 RepID=UPI00286E0D90|nr:hypothetical protein [Sphaerotilus sp.]
MAQEQETNNNQAEVSTTKLVVRGNILAFDSTVFQISNISTVSVKEITKTTHHERSLMPFFWVIFGGGLIWLWKNNPGLQQAVENQIKTLNWSEDLIPIASVINFIFIVGSLIEIFSFKKTTATSRTFLSVEMNSGNQTLFASNDKGFMLRAASALLTP